MSTNETPTDDRNSPTPHAGIPSILVKFGKYAWKSRDTIVSGAGYLLYEGIGDILQAPAAGDEGQADTWRLFRYRWDNLASQDNADAQYMDFEVVNITGGLVDNSWTTQDYLIASTELTEICKVVQGVTATYLHCTKVEAYTRAFAAIGAYDPAYDPATGKRKYVKHFVDSGPPVWTAPLDMQGTASGQSAPQISSTVTEETPLQRHWGRIYLPTIGSNHFDAAGRLGQPTVDSLNSVFGLRYGQLHDAGFNVVVVTTMANRIPSHVLQNVTGTRVDNVLDVIRRRRYKHRTYAAGATPAATKPAP